MIIQKKNSNFLLKKMTNTIKHKLWQETYIYRDIPLHIGRVHLGIINTEPQPFSNKEKSIFIFMYGEIFNNNNTKKSKLNKNLIKNDLEFCLKLYKKYGEEFVRKLNGSFIIVIYDKNKEKIIVVNDRYGLRTFYYTKIGQKFLFSSEVKAFFKDKDFKKQINYEAIADFFAFGRIFGEKTFFKEVQILPPGSILTWSESNGLHKRKY
jgi:asparagine synthase (glutamine-hydrolysing)